MPISAPKIPDGLPELMRGLAKSVIKENPENLYVHAAEYFENLIRERDGVLDHGYPTFNAYQAYADYKEKTREKLGLPKDPSLSDGNGGDGDESGSGDSESKVRGRKRRRARKPSFRERDNPATMVGNPSVSDEGEPQRLKSLSEESAPVPVVEQEVVKVHYNPPEASPVRIVSAQSVEAEQAVSSILDDEQILDSDGTGEKETGDELVDNGDDIGTAPSTAEITEQSGAAAGEVEPSGEMALQDMETCFMHANVDDLLEKHSEDHKPEESDGMEKVPVEAKLPSASVGEDIPEGPQNKENTNIAAEEGTSETKEEVEDGNENEMQKISVEEPQDDSEVASAPLEEVVSEKVPDDVAIIGESKEMENYLEKNTENLAEADLVSSNDDFKPVKVEENNPDSPATTEQNDGQARPIEGQDTVDETNLNEMEPTDLPATQSRESTDLSPEKVPSTSDDGEKAKEDSSAQSSGNDLKISPRMGFDDDSLPEATVEAENTQTETGTPEKESSPVLEANETNQPMIETKEPEDERVKVEVEGENLNDIAISAQDMQAVDSEALLKDEQEQPSDIDNAELLKDTQDKPSDVDPPTKPVENNSTTSTEVEPESNEKQESVEPKESAVDANEEAEQTTVENIVESPTKSANDDTKAVTEQESMVSAETKEETISISEAAATEDIETKDNQSSKPVADPVIDRSETSSEPQATAKSSIENIVDTKIEIENEPSSSGSGDKEVNKECTVTDENGLLIKDRSLEDVAHADETVSDVDNPTEAMNEEESIQENAPVQAQTNNDENKFLEKSNEGTVLVEPTDKEDGVAKEDGKQHHQEPDNANADDQDNSKASLEAPATISADVSPILCSSVVEEMQTSPEPGKEIIEDQGNSSESAEGIKTATEDANLALESVVAEETQNLRGNVLQPMEEIASEVTVSDDAANDADPTTSDVPVETQAKASVAEGVPDTEAASESKDSSDRCEATVEPQEPLAALPESDDGTPKREVSLEEVIEEPCVKREITPSKTGPLEKDDSSEKQVEELEEIKKVDLSQLSKDSAEALFYSLKKSELANQEVPIEDGTEQAEQTGIITDVAISPQTGDNDDDQDVVVKEEPVSAPNEERTKRSFTDDFLDETPITDAPSTSTTMTMPRDGAAKDDTSPPVGSDHAASLEADEQKDEFNPMVMVSMRSKQFQEQLHSRGSDEQMTDEQTGDAIPKRPIMRRCMTEMSGLQRYDAAMEEEEPVADNRQEDPSYVEEEDQFDGYYIGHIKNKILASSVSVADSDCPDGTRSSVESVDENNVRTALETIASTDTESTIASQATIQQAAGRRSYLRKHSQNTSSNIPYASFGNAAIDQSLDEFIEREEQHKQDEAMAEAATKIQRSYRTHKKKLLRDYHSTMRTFTEDHSAESGEEYAANVIKIKLDQRRADGVDPAGGDAGEESDSTTASHQPLGASGRRPMYSLNIDEYDTVARRMTLTRGVAMQRNSTPEDDSGKSANVSTDRKPSHRKPSSGAAAKKDSALASESGGDSPSSDEKPPEPGETVQGSSDEREPKDGTLSSSRSKPKSGPAGTTASERGRDQRVETVPRTAIGRTTFAPLDVQNLLLIARQRTMPVQIDSSVIRVLPKHMRKRISSAGMLHGNGKRK
uniref:RIIa domain-containing protein n=1 Tax=Anopheles epiroticus TaxID=199890 RepID=A0A182PLH4_9DIPT